MLAVAEPKKAKRTRTREHLLPVGTRVRVTGTGARVNCEGVIEAVHKGAFPYDIRFTEDGVLKGMYSRKEVEVIR